MNYQLLWGLEKCMLAIGDEQDEPLSEEAGTPPGTAGRASENAVGLGERSIFHSTAMTPGILPLK